MATEVGLVACLVVVPHSLLAHVVLFLLDNLFPVGGHILSVAVSVLLCGKGQANVWDKIIEFSRIRNRKFVKHIFNKRVLVGQKGRSS